MSVCCPREGRWVYIAEDTMHIRHRIQRTQTGFGTKNIILEGITIIIPEGGMNAFKSEKQAIFLLGSDPYVPH